MPRRSAPVCSLGAHTADGACANKLLDPDQGYGGAAPQPARMEPAGQQSPYGSTTEQPGQDREQFGQPQTFYDELPAPNQVPLREWRPCYEEE